VESEEALSHLRAQDLRVPRAFVDQHRAVGESARAPVETGSAAETGRPTVPLADVVDALMASDAYDSSPTVVERLPSPPAATDDSPTLTKADQTLVLPAGDLPARVSEETLVLPIDETQVLPPLPLTPPIDSSPTQVLPPLPPTPPTDNSPTQVLSLDELALPIDDSPARAEPDETGSAPPSGSESPAPEVPEAARNDTPRIRWFGRRRAR
jgi:hypothetical protein